MMSRGSGRLRTIMAKSPGAFVVTLSTEEGKDEKFIFRAAPGVLFAIEADSEFARRFGPYATGAAIYAAVNSFRKAAELKMACGTGESWATSTENVTI